VTDAFYLDYNGIVISDCVATNSEEVNRVHLEDIRKYLGQVMDSETLFAKLESGEL
jgi:isochorismate hydrolase